MLVSLLRSFARTGAAAVPALAILLYGAPARADDGRDPGVARLSVLAGEVDIKRADSDDSFAGALNAPVSPGDYLTTQDDSRAEVELDYGAALRVAPNTQLRFTQLAPQTHQLQLAVGTVELRVFRGLEAHPEVETPSASVRPDAHGSYRVTVTEDGNTQVTVRAGQADVATASGVQTIGPGATLVVTGSGNAAQFATLAAVPLDAFDRFNDDRDAFIARARDDRYVDAGMVGADDLDQYGHWIDAPSYGQVWVPSEQDTGWAPYHDGRWVWTPYYGWTWVGYEPWGWAPYHYGNWFYAAGTGWCWYPGAYAIARPYVYRPALVAFFSFGGGVGPSLAFGNVGWVPVAPFEPFRPWWGGGGWGYGGTTIVNNTTVVNINNVYRNAGAPGGAVAVSSGNFSSGNFSHVQPVTPAELRTVEPVHGVVPIVPTTHNLAFNPSRLAPVAAPLADARFAHFAPPPRAPQPFVAQRAAVATTAQKTYPERANFFSTQAHPQTVPPKFGSPANATGSSDPWSRFNAPPRQNPSTPSYAEPKTYVAPKTYVPPSTYVAPKTSVAPKTYVAPKSFVAPKTSNGTSHPAHPSKSAHDKEKTKT